MNNFLIKYFEVIGFVLGIIVGLCSNRISNFIQVNIVISIVLLILGVTLFIWGLIVKNTLISLDYNLSKGKRDKELIYDNEVWICQNNSMFQIRKGSDHSDFSEVRTKVYPDSLGSGKYTVEVIENGVIIKTLTWIYCDGGRISVPMPQIENLSNNFVHPQIQYFWDRNTIEFKIAKIIGDFYIYKNIEKIAEISNIVIK